MFYLKVIIPIILRHRICVTTIDYYVSYCCGNEEHKRQAQLSNLNQNACKDVHSNRSSILQELHLNVLINLHSIELAGVG